jgi:hypothetical protein
LPIVPHIFDIFANKWCWLQFDSGKDFVQNLVKRLKNEKQRSKILLSVSQPFFIGEIFSKRKEKFKC